MDTKAISDRLQGFIDELIRADGVTDAAKIVAAKAEATERLISLLSNMPKAEKPKLEMPKAKPGSAPFKASAETDPAKVKADTSKSFESRKRGSVEF